MLAGECLLECVSGGGADDAVWGESLCALQRLCCCQCRRPEAAVGDKRWLRGCGEV